MLDTRRLNRIIVDEVDMTVTAQCGVILSDLQDAVGERGFECQTVAVPQRYTTLGDVLSGVVGGGLPREMPTRGGTGQFVLGLTVVLPDGTLVKTNAGGSNVHRTRSVVSATDGPTLTQLFIGDGGLLGVKVEATLRLLPIAPHMDAGAWMFDELDQAWQALVDLTSFRELPYSTVTVAGDPPWSFTYGVRAGDPALIPQRTELIRRTLAARGGREDDAEQVEYALAGLKADAEWAKRVHRRRSRARRRSSSASERSLRRDGRVVERRGRAQVALCYLRPHRRPALATRSLGDPPVGTRPFAGGASA